MKLKERIGREFVITGEVEPGADLSGNFLQKAEIFAAFTKTLNSIDSPLGIPQLSSLASSLALKENGFEPIMQICARDRNKTAIINDILGARYLGIENILAITGDYPKEAKAVYELDSLSLLRLLKKEMPKDCPEFEITAGAAYNPMAEPNEPERMKLKKKLRYADFIQTQMVFDADQLDSELVRKNKEKILVGVMPLLPKFIDYFNKHIPGVSISEKTKKRVSSAEKGVALANEVANFAKEEGFAGVHLMVFEAEDRIADVLKGVI